MKTQILKLIPIVLLLSLEMLSPPAAAREVFPDSTQLRGVDFALRGTGLKSVFFIRAFHAGLYLPEEVSSRQALNDVPKHLEVRYLARIPARKLRAYTIKSIKKNCSPEEFAAISGRVREMEGFFVDLEPGDRFTLTYIPDVGTEFRYNKEVIGTIPGGDFARALFSTWIGNEPFDPTIKQQILGLDPSSDGLQQLTMN